MEWLPGGVTSPPSLKKKKRKIKSIPCGKPLLARMLRNVLQMVEPDQKVEAGEVRRTGWKPSETKGRSQQNSGGDKFMALWLL